MQRSALIVVDVQVGLVEGFEDEWTDALAAIHRTIARARAADAPVVFVQHRGAVPAHPLHPDRPGWRLHPDLDIRPDDPRVEKTWSDAFRDTDLDRVLRERGVARVLLVGAQTEFCVDASARRAASLGYDVVVVADGHTTSGNGILTRAQIIAHTNRTLEGLAVVGVDVRAIPSDELVLT